MELNTATIAKLTDDVSHPGKFEGQNIATPWFWDLALNGEGEEIFVPMFPELDEDLDSDVGCFEPHDPTLFTVFDIQVEEAKAFGLVGRHYMVWEDSQGFVHGREFSIRDEIDLWIKQYMGL